MAHPTTRGLDLETPDPAPLLGIGFKYPEPFTVKADDGITDLYGVMNKPFDFDASKSYPIIAWHASARGLCQGEKSCWGGGQG